MPRRLVPTLLLLSALAAAPAARGAPPVEAASRVDAVTVYRSSARVGRVARLELPAGAARVVLAGLPDTLDDDSIRVAGQGSARARLFGVTVERVTGAEAAAEGARAAEEKLERLALEDRALDDRIAAARARAEFVVSLRSTYSEERSRNLAVRGVSAREWGELAAFVSDELARASAERRRAEQEKRTLAGRVVQARAELEKLQAKRAVTTKTVTVEVEAERAGAFELALSYLVHAAGWRPLWDARLSPERSTVELAFVGAVWQSSGEDWGDVKLAVSTAEPARGLTVPQLSPVWLTRWEPRRAEPVHAQRRSRSLSLGAPSAPMAAPAPVAELEDADEPMEVAQASLSEGLLAATFTAPRRETVDGSGQQRKIALARFPLQATLTRTAAPRLEAAAYLTARAVNDTGFPLPAGEAGVYVDDDFVGRAAIPATPAGGELELAFGQDARVEVERRVLERARETQGLLSKEEVVRYRVRVKVQNRYAAPAAVKLLELVPVSQDEKIVVKVLEGTTAATREDPDRPGVRVHELALGPREERVVELRYEVRWPRGVQVAGLE